MKTSVIKYLEPLHVFNGSCDVISSNNSGFPIKTGTNNSNKENYPH